MKLKEYINRFPEYDIQDFVKGLGVARATLWKAIEGKRMDLEVAVKIQKGTAGLVRCEDLLGSDHEDNKLKDENNKQQQQNQAASDAPV
jgi:sulfatase maturation enzyme AslB (radical SAM superfamily)